MAAEQTPRGRLPRQRVLVLLGAAAVVAAIVVGLAVLATAGGDPKPAAAARPTTAEPLPGRPAIALPPAAAEPSGTAARVAWARRQLAAQPGTAAQLRLAAALVAARDDAAARAVLAGSSDPAAQAALALIDYDDARPGPAVARLRALAAKAPASAFVGFSYGAALIWSGQRAAGEEALRRVRDADPETFYGVAADDLIHPSAPPGSPPFIPAEAVPARTLAQLQAAAVARPDDAQAQIAVATALLGAGRRAEAADAFDAALQVEPGSVEARVGKIIATYAKDAPARSFGQMGPLVRDNPTNPSPRLHLALMLIWIRDLDTARAELRQVAAADPTGRLGAVAQRFLDSL